MAVNFNGSGDIIVNGASTGSTNISNNAPLAMSCWVNFSSLTGTQTFLNKGFDGTNTAYQFQSVSGTPNTLFWGSFVNPTTHGPTWSPSTLATGTWYNIYGEYTGNPGSTIWNLYVANSLVATSTDATGPVVASQVFAAGGIITSGSPTGTQFFAGCMADAALYAAPLSGTERANLANGTLRPNTSMSQSLLLYWKMDVAGNQTDLSGNGNTGTATGTTTCGTSPPFNVPVITLMGAICC